MSKNTKKSLVTESGGPPEWKQYRSYQVQIDPLQDDKAVELRLCDISRPHMRAFHCCWWSFFVAFFIWFSITPLLPDIRDSLGMTQDQVWTSSIISVGSTIVIRLIVGPLCDRFGAVRLFSILLCCVSIPTACLGFVTSIRGLYIIRMFIGLAGGSFVMCEYWSSCLFANEVVGTANALTAGWGNLGAGVTQLVLGSALYPILKFVLDDTEMAWRTICVLPALVAFATGAALPFICDDSPKGNFRDLKRHGMMKEVSLTASMIAGTFDWNTWILAIQYAACFGVELTMNIASALYFRDVFGQSNESASAIAAIFGWMNLFARGLGGYFSDRMNVRLGMRGRIWAQTILLLGEGIMVMLFVRSETFGGAICTLIIFSLFVQSSEGTSFGIVPYINPQYTGSVCGIVGAGGNVGAVLFGLCFREFNYDVAFDIMGYSILVATALSVFIRIKGHSSILFDTQVRDENV